VDPLAYEALVEASTAALAAEDAALKVAAMDHRVAAAEGLPSMERTRVALSSAQVKNYVLVSAGLDNFLVVWNVASGEVLRRLYGHDDQVNCVRFFNDSTGIVSCSGDLTLKVWYLTPQPPAAPAKPQVTKTTGFTMTVQWQQPPAFNEEVTAFHLQRRVGSRGAFGHDATAAGDACLIVVDGLLPATAYQFRVRAVNRMGVGAWSDPSALATTEVDVPDAVARPEVLEVTSSSLGVAWLAPTAVVAGTSIGRFVVQLAGGGVSYSDKVQRICTWAESAAHHR